MSESEGLQKLTAYLNQTRRQAELAVDALNQQIEDLRKENDLYAQLCKKLEQEKEYFRGLADQLKQGGTTKQMLQERDDWRALIDNVQKDRARLQEECCALEFNLDAANEEIAKLRDAVEHLQHEQQQQAERGHNRANGTPHRSNTSSPSPRTPLSIQCDHEVEENGEGEGEGKTSPSPLVSPIVDRSGREVAVDLSAPPQQVIRQLQLELKRAYAQLATERQQAEADRIAYQVELSRLQDRLGANGRGGGAPGSGGRTYVLNGLDSSSAGLLVLAGHGVAGAAGGNGRGGHASVGGGAGSAGSGSGAAGVGSWLNPLSYVGYWFGSNGSSSGSAGGTAGGGGGDTIIIKV